MHSFEMDMHVGVLRFPTLDPSVISFPKNVEKFGLQFVLLRLDTAVLSCSMETSLLEVFSKDDSSRAVAFECAVPPGEGILLALLYFGFCKEVNGEAYFLSDPNNVLEVVDYNGLTVGLQPC